VRGAVQSLKSRCPKVGVTGFCMGGALTLLAAVNVPEADAGVVWYGFPPLEYIDASKITMPLMGHYAIDDVPFPIATVDTLADKLRAAKVNFEFHRYKAMHAFANETQVGANRLPITEYQPEAAALAWGRTVAFFDKHLK
jgi:carboxymethylenebutenolidase